MKYLLLRIHTRVHGSYFRWIIVISMMTFAEYCDTVHMSGLKRFLKLFFVKIFSDIFHEFRSMKVQMDLSCW